MNYRNIFENLKTVRDFKKNNIETKAVEALKEYGKSLSLPNNGTFEIISFDGNEGFHDLNGKIGYFGKLIEAPLYLAIVGNESNSLVDAGYFTEAVRLKIQDLGLGSCWISIEGSEAVDEFLGVKKVFTVLAIGEVYNGIFKKDIQVKAERNAVSDIVFEKTWGNEITWERLNAIGLDEVFYFARFAPSWGNQQPWKFIIEDSKIYLLIKKENADSYELETGIISLFLEKACVAAGVTVDPCYNDNSKDFGQPSNYRVSGIFAI